jgi:hypothetical protein
MKKSFLLLGIFALLLSACSISNNGVTINTATVTGSGVVTTETRSVSGFDAVALQSIGDVKISHGDTESITIKADDNLLPYITTEVENGTLEISTKPGYNINPSGTIVYEVTVKELSAVTLSGFGNIDVDSLSGASMSARLTGSGDIRIDEVTGDAFTLDLTGFGNVDLAKVAASAAELNLTGSGDITLPDLSADDLDLTISGFGDASVSGVAPKQTVSLTGSGDYNGGDLKSETATLTISGFGNATAWVTDTINITITGSGNVKYYGSPTVSTTLTGFGSVESLGEH